MCRCRAPSLTQMIVFPLSADDRCGDQEEALGLAHGFRGSAQLLLQREGPGQQSDERRHQHADRGYREDSVLTSSSSSSFKKWFNPVSEGRSGLWDLRSSHDH